MELTKIQKDFEETRLSIRFLGKNPRRRWSEDSSTGFFVDVQTDRKGREEFAMFMGKDSEVRILDRNPNIRHVLLMVQTASNKEKFLLGHDERHLFIAPLGRSRASTVNDAFGELKPAEVLQAQRKSLKVVRQGEWFFVPAPDFNPPKDCPVRRKENIGGPRWGGNPHVADELVRVPIRTGDRLLERVYVQCKVRHGEHSTVEFRHWHRVYRNVEVQDHSAVAFVD